MNTELNSGDNVAVVELPLVSILIVNYNGQPHLKEFCESVFALNYPGDKYEVVMVDNASNDGSPDWIEKNYPKVRMVRLEKNYGFAGGDNIGVTEHCRGKFIALINNDTVLDKNWLIELVKAALKDPDAIYGSKMFWYSHRDYIVYSGGRVLAWGYPFHIETYAKDKVQTKNEPVLTMYADGCGVLLSKETFIKIGGFDESYFCYCEDYELSWKAWLAGHKVYFVPTARFYHKVSSTLGSRSKAVIYYFVRNQARNIIKFTGLSSLLVMLPFYILYNYAQYLMVFCCQERKFSLVFPIIQANISTIKEFPALLKVRKKFQKNRKISDAELRRLGLIAGFRESVSESLDTFKRKNAFVDL